MTQLDPHRSLELLGPEQARLCERIVNLEQAQLVAPSNLAGWSVEDLAVHITRVCDSINLATQRALVGDTTPAFGPAARPRELEIRAMGQAAWADLQRSSTRQIADRVGGLTAAHLESSTFPHPMGERSIRWYCTQLLTEVVFHRWDIERSLGDDAPLDNSMADYLLSFMLDENEHLFGRLRTEGPPTTFIVSAGPERRWTISVADDGTSVRAGTHRNAPVISADPGWLALALYGRARVDNPTFTTSGSPDLADQFASVFGPKE